MHALPNTGSGLVTSVGSIRETVLGGDLTARLDLRSLIQRPDLYGIGPLDRLTGEVTILDGLASVATVRDGQVVVTTDLGGSVPFFVWAYVPYWLDVAVPPTVEGVDGMASFIVHIAAELGIDVSQAFPFLLDGAPEWIEFHIVDNTDDEPHTPELHEKIKARFQLEDRAMRMIGFYSEHDRGVFVPPGSPVHIHFSTEDGTSSGHLEQAEWGPGMTLRLPVVGGTSA